MASRTKLIGLQTYDSDGALDWFYRGTEFKDYFERRMLILTKDLDLGVARGLIRNELLSKFKEALDAAIPYHCTKCLYPGGGLPCLICGK